MYLDKRVKEICKRIGTVFIAAIATGTVCGILLRIIMRIIAIAFPELASGVTFEGVLQLLGTGIGFCLALSFYLRKCTFLGIPRSISSIVK